MVAIHAVGRAILAGPVSTGLLPLWVASLSPAGRQPRRRLPSTGITPLPRYYAAVRLPVRLLAPSLCLACRPYSLQRAAGASRVDVSQPCTTCRGLRPRGSPKEPRHWRFLGCCLPPYEQRRPSRWYISGLNPFSLAAFGPPPRLPTLKPQGRPSGLQGWLPVDG